MKRISVFISSLLVGCLFAFSAQALEKVKVQIPDTIPFFNGFNIGVDLLSPVSSILGNGFTGSEISLDVDLKHRYFPTIELGGGTFMSEKEGLSFSMNGAFGRIGVNRNLFANNQAKFFGYIGGRYGFATEKYDYKGLSTVEGYWKTSRITNLMGKSAQTHWVELLAGVRVQIYKQVSMGWIFRYHFRIAQTSSSAGEPFYVPGYGTNNSSGTSMNYSVYFSF